MNDEIQNEFQKLGDEWSQAILSNNAESIGRFMADDWVIVGESGITQKRDFLAMVESGVLTHEMIERISETSKTLREHCDCHRPRYQRRSL